MCLDPILSKSKMCVTYLFGSVIEIRCFSIENVGFTAKAVRSLYIMIEADILDVGWSYCMILVK